MKVGIKSMDVMSPNPLLDSGLSAPVSHQKRSYRSATNLNEFEQNRGKIKETHLCPPAHNGLVVGRIVADNRRIQ